MKQNALPKILLIAIAGSFLAACASEPQVDARPEARTDAGLYPVKGASMDEVFVDVEADFNSYQKLHIAKLDTSTVEVDYDADPREWRNREWELTEKDKQGLEAMFAKAVASNFEVSGVTLVDQAGAGVLVIEPVLKKLEPSAPKDSFDNRNPGDRYYSEGAGRVTLELTFKDGASGKVIGTALDRRDAGTEWRQNTAINNRWEVQRLFNRWVSMLDSNLEKARQ